MGEAEVRPTRRMSMSRAARGAVAVGLVTVLAAGAMASAQESPTGPVAPKQEPLVVYDFEENLQGWAIPDWAKESAYDVGKSVTFSREVASHGTGSMQVIAEFPGSQWQGAYVEVFMYVTDWSPFSSMSVDIYLPPNAPRGLLARFILTVGEKWEWTEMNRPLPLEPGQWTTIAANLKPGSLDWKFFPTETFRKDIRKVGIRLESDKQPAYSGPVYLDALRLSP